MKCCWSGCRKKATCSVGNNLNKGYLDMCEECYKNYNKHTSSREKIFMKDAITLVRNKLNDVDHKIDCIFNPGLKYGSQSTGSTNAGGKKE